MGRDGDDHVSGWAQRTSNGWESWWHADVGTACTVVGL